MPRRLDNAHCVIKIPHLKNKIYLYIDILARYICLPFQAKRVTEKVTHVTSDKSSLHHTTLM